MMKLARQQKCYSTKRKWAMPISCCSLNVISDRIAAETQLTEEESIEFSSDITIILRLVYKHTFRMLRKYRSLERLSGEHRALWYWEQRRCCMMPLKKAKLKLIGRCLDQLFLLYKTNETKSLQQWCSEADQLNANNMTMLT